MTERPARPAESVSEPFAVHDTAGRQHRDVEGGIAELGDEVGKTMSTYVPTGFEALSDHVRPAAAASAASCAEPTGRVSVFLVVLQPAHDIRPQVQKSVTAGDPLRDHRLICASSRSAGVAAGMRSTPKGHVVAARTRLISRRMSSAARAPCRGSRSRRPH